MEKKLERGTHHSYAASQVRIPKSLLLQLWSERIRKGNLGRGGRAVIPIGRKGTAFLVTFQMRSLKCF